MVLMTLVAAVPSSAATVTSANDFPSTLQAGQGANHRVVFTTNGIAEGTTLALTFSSTFDTSAITEDDVDIADDSVDLTTAANCAGTEQAGVTMIADVLTITICAGDGGAIAPGSQVAIEIGTNAAASGTGANQVVNPSGVSTRFIAIGGTFGDSGSIILPIGSDDSIAFTVSVNQPPDDDIVISLDRTGPVISNVLVSNVTTTSATITWNTDESADGKVDYGLTTGYEIGIGTDTSMLTAHTIVLTGLTEGTEYLFRVRSADMQGNEASSSGYSFRTLDLTAPEIRNIQVVDITTSSARITWETNEPATSLVNYGTSASYGFASSETETFVVTHSVLLTGLSSGTLYHFQVGGKDAWLNRAVSADTTFTTLVNLPPGNVTNLAVAPGNRVNTLTWLNPVENDLAGIRVLACLRDFPSSPSDPSCTVVFDAIGETFTHGGLINGVTYYYGVFAYDTIGQFSSGTLGSGTPVGTPVVCGNGFCESGESALSCSRDCPAEPAPECGDNICQISETPTLCPADCTGEDEQIIPVCGNGVCEAQEEGVCRADCPVIVLPEDEDDVPEVTVTPLDPTSEAGQTQEQVEFYVANRVIQLFPRRGYVHTLPMGRLYTQVPARSLSKSVDRVTLRIGQSLYLMAPNFSVGSAWNLRVAPVGEDAYMAETDLPTSVGNRPLIVTVEYADGSVQTLPFVLVVEPLGRIFEIVDEQEFSVASATVTLLEGSEGRQGWDGSPSTQMNPTMTGQSGQFGWYALNGDYAVRAAKGGYRQEHVRTTITDNLVHPVIRMRREEEVLADVSVLFGLIDQARDFGAAVNEKLDVVRALPGVRQIAEVSLPVLAATAVASSVVLAVAFDFLPLLQYVFTSPVLLFWRRKRKGFGVVYDSVSKQPIDLAIVRLFRLADGKLVASRVTDMGGRYFFLAQPGTYRIEAVKSAFVFPSEYLADVRDDRIYLDVYHGEQIRVTDNNAVITANIPLDPKIGEKESTPTRILWTARLRRLQRGVAVSGVIAAIVFAILRPTTSAYVMIAVQISIFLLVRRLVHRQKPKSWGIVYDRTTGRPLSRVIARIFEPRYNKLLATAVTDSKGRYHMLLGPSEYYATFEREGFEEREIRPIDLRAAGEPQPFVMKVKLDPQSHVPSLNYESHVSKK